MKRAHLVPCPSCARHVRVSEAACPFCRGALDESLRAQPAPQAAPARLSRAALYALGAAGTVTLAAACSQSVYGAPVTPDDAGPRDAGPPMVDAAYGGPPIDGGFDADDGAPPVVDAGRDADDDASPLVDAAYGGPPIDGGQD